MPSTPAPHFVLITAFWPPITFAAMQDVEHRRAARCCAIQVNVIRIENIQDSHHCRNGGPALVDTAAGSRVRMRVDNSRHDKPSSTVDDFRVCRCVHAGSEFFDLAVLKPDGAIRDRSFGDGQQRSVPNHEILRSRFRLRRTPRRQGRSRCILWRRRSGCNRSRIIRRSSLRTIWAGSSLTSLRCLRSLRTPGCRKVELTIDMTARTLASFANMSPLKRIRLAIFPFSSVPSCASAPRISAGEIVSARSAPD